MGTSLLETSVSTRPVEPEAKTKPLPILHEPYGLQASLKQLKGLSNGNAERQAARQKCSLVELSPYEIESKDPNLKFFWKAESPDEKVQQEESVTTYDPEARRLSNLLVELIDNKQTRLVNLTFNSSGLVISCVETMKKR